MRISKIIIKGFRCFDSNGATFKSLKNLNVFIGHNSAGKTTAMEALVKLFGRTRAEREIKKTDFYRTVPSSVLQDGSKLSIEVRLRFDSDDSTVPLFFKNMIVDGSSEKPYVRIRLDAVWKKDPRNADGVVEQEMCFWQNPESEDMVNPNKIVFKSTDFSRIQIYYVPAVRRTADELRYSSNSLLQRMLKLISYDETFKQNTKATLQTVDDAIQKKDEFVKIKEVLIERWSKFHKDSRYDCVEIGMLCDDVEQFLRKLEVTFTSTTEGDDIYQIEDLGDGYKSLFYLTMICSLLESERKLKDEEELATITILAVEEPENHIAPHLLGRVVHVFESISKKKYVQVFMSTHSSALVGRVDPKCITHFQNKNKKAIINKIALPEEKCAEYKFVKEAVQHWPEIYFAKLVVIGEGDSEEVIFKHLSKRFDYQFDENEITFFPLGHRFIHHIWNLLEQLQIPYVTLLDLDYGRPGGGWGRIKYVLQEMSLHKKCDENFWEKAPFKITDSEIEQMHTWKKTEKKHACGDLKRWCKYLEEKNIFFSSPLDIDYLMLTIFFDEYTKVDENEGPNIPDEDDSGCYNKYCINAIKATLKQDSVDLDSFPAKEIELMIWYKYLFLGRGKPITHVIHLPNIKDECLKDGVASIVLGRIFSKIETLVNEI